MALSVSVRSFTGEVISELLGPAVASLCNLARKRDLPFLGSVDFYDDTVFNRLQVPRVLAELESLRGIGGAEDDVAIGEISAMIETVGAKPHRYLLFNGD